MNKIIMTGRLTKDVEPRYTQTGKCVSRFNIAVNGYKKDDTNFFNVVAWDKLGELCGNYLTKGSKILVEGQLISRSYDDSNGNKKTAIEINASNVEFLDTKKKHEQEQQQMSFATAQKLKNADEEITF